MNPSGRALPGALRARLAALPAAARSTELLAHVRARGAWFLQLASAEAIPPHAPWTELGLDSLRAVDFRGELAHDLDLELRSTLLFDQPTPQTLVAHLLERLGPVVAPDPRPAPAPLPVNESIAIVGAACRFPGGESLTEFQRLLDEGRDAVAPIPRERFDIDAYYDPDPNADGKLYVREAALLRQIDRFDAGCFGISPREAVILDPQQRLLLETSLHALEHANLPPASLPGDRVGVYVGMRASAYFDSQSGRTAAEATAYQATGNEISTAAGRIAYTFGFQGPCYALDTACSGSLVAVHVAVRALRARECDVALAGGVNTIYDPVTMSGLCRARMLSPDGRCKTFDASANGYGRGEGCGIVVLKRLGDALAAGDRVLAVVRGTAINQDGRSGGLTVPHGPSQTAVIRAALADAGVGVDAIDYVEAHGTGTALGDPIEVGALDAAFAGRTRPLPIGSVKTNIGHLESAAGISGLLKVALALQARTLPKNLHFHRGNPHIDWARSITRVVTEPTPLPRDRELLAGVSSFGFSGTNAHVVLATAPAPYGPPTCAPAPVPRGPFLLGLQAMSPDALRALALAHADALERGPVDLAAWCHAAAVGRAAGPQRAAFVAHDRVELVAALRTFGAGNDAGAAAVGVAAAPAPPIAFLFPGQGAQRAGMGRELYEQEPAFRDALDAANERLAGALPASLPDLLFGQHTDLLDRTDVTQPALCAYELALLATFRAVGVVPEQVLGHSIGDFPAAVAAGAMDGGDALRLCAARGRLMVERCAPGGLLVVLAPLERWQARLAAYPGASIAVRNGTANFAVGGERTVLQTLQRDLETANVPTRLLPVSHAFHTAQTEPMLAPFADLVERTRLRPPERTFIDCRRGTFAGPELATGAHWRAQVREPVDFLAGLQLLAQGPCRVWFELGPSPMLTVLARDVARRSVRVLPAQRPGLAGRAGLLAALADAWTHGVAVDLAAANHCRGRAHAELPGYPFQRERFWLERAASVVATHPARPGPGHPLLGERIDSSLLAEGQSLHRSRLELAEQPWLADHAVFEQTLLPAAAMFEMALAAEATAGSPLPLALRNVALRAPRPLTATTTTTLELLRTSTDHGSARVSMRGRDDDGTFRIHLDGNTGPWSGVPPIGIDLVRLRADCSDRTSPERLYARAAALHLAYGPAFQGIREVHSGPTGVLVRVQLPDELAPSARTFVLHPALLDACFQACLVLTPDDGRCWLPIGVEELVVFRRHATTGLCHLRVRTHGDASLTCDLTLAAEDGSPIATASGLQLVPAKADAIVGASLRDQLHHVTWDTAPAADPAPLPERIVLVDGGDLAAALARALPAGTATTARPEGLAHELSRRRADLVLVFATGAGVSAEATFVSGLAVLQAVTALTPPPRLGFVTHGCSDAGYAPAGPSPVAAVVPGLVRTLALEHPALRPFLLDLDPLLPGSAVAAQAMALAAELRTTLDEPEVALRAGTRRVRRLQRGPAPTDRLAIPSGPFRVRTRAYGSFDHLTCLPLVRRPPGPDEIEVELRATALNFKDVLHARGLLRTFSVQFGVESPEQQPLGLEGTGVVVACGANVRDLVVGDTVVVQAYDCLASHVTVTARHAFVVPKGIDPTTAAGTPVTGSTVLHGLFDLARVRPGETVLVHAAAGGVGQAAIALLRAHGCRVLATASAAKRAFVQGLGVEVVGDTRGGDCRDAVRAATNGRGVDVVLNTLAGEFVPRSLDVLAPGGRFVELGKLGVWTAEQVAAVRPDVRFFAFELGEASQRDPGLLPGLYARVHRALLDGTLTPPTTTVLPLARLREAFDHLARGHHVGKVVVTFPRRGEAIQADRAWLVTGGSGGVGHAVANALVEAGARHLVLLARGDVPPSQLEGLRARGATVRAIRADVADRDALAAALRTARATLPPFQGVVHAAGTLGDAMLATLSPAPAAATLAPKVTGALLLDELLADEPIEHFVLTSSMAGTFGNAGQAAYAAANTFLDAFAAWRRARGRPATSIAFGPWAEAGMAARLDERLRARLQQSGIGFLPPAATARLLVQQRAAAHDFAVLPIRWAEWLATLRPPTPRFFAAVRPKDTTMPATACVRLDLGALPHDQRRPALHRAVQEQIAKVLGFANGDPFGSGRSFRDFGLDSLLAVDAKDRLERLTGLTLPATLLFDQPDLERLVAHLLATMFPG